MTCTARPYQSRAATLVRESWLRGGTPLCVLPTGAGKTVVAGLAFAGAAHPVVISHTTTLREQLAARLPGVQSLTVQGLLDMSPTAARALLANCDRCAIDEAHHYPRGSRWGAVLNLLPPGCLVVGFTATPERTDGAGLAGTFTDLIATASYGQLLAAGWLSSCEVVPCPALAGSPAAAYLSFARSHAVRCGGAAVVVPAMWRPGVLFTPTKDAAAAAVASLLAAGVRAVAIDADTTDTARQAAFRGFDAGELDVLASPMALSEGFDSPRAEVCVLDRTCQGLALYLQTAGRVLRPHPTKREGALLLDCRGAAERHGSPTEDRVYSLEGVGIRRVPVVPAVPRSVARVPRAPAKLVYLRARPGAPVRRAAPGILSGLWRWLWSA